MATDTFEAKLAQLKANSKIRALVSRYCFAIDDRDLDAVAALFAPDARVWSEDGVMHAVGIDAIVHLYKGRYASLGATNHVTHDHLISHESPNEASGRVSAHAEVWRDGTAMVTALRYADRYARIGDRWRFRERKLSFLYYLPFRDYADALGRLDRMHAYGDRRPADYPERLSTWRDYR